jgi:hypothetical protein
MKRKVIKVKTSDKSNKKHFFAKGDSIFIYFFGFLIRKGTRTFIFYSNKPSCKILDLWADKITPDKKKKANKHAL